LTKFLSNVENKYFDHIRLLLRALSLNPSALKNWIIDQCKSEKELDTELAADFGLSGEDLTSVFWLSLFTAEQTECKADELSDVAKILAITYNIDELKEETCKQSFVDFIKSIYEGLIAHRARVFKKEALDKGVATFYGMAISPVLKFKRTEDVDVSEIDVSSYNPKPDIVRAFLFEIAIRTTLGQEHIAFQATEANLRKIKNILEIAEAEMKALSSAYKR